MIFADYYYILLATVVGQVQGDWFRLVRSSLDCLCCVSRCSVSAASTSSSLLWQRPSADALSHQVHPTRVSLVWQVCTLVGVVVLTGGTLFETVHRLWTQCICVCCLLYRGLPLACWNTPTSCVHVRSVLEHHYMVNSDTPRL